MNPQLKRGTLELCVLSIVCRTDCYGYELVNQISNCMHITEGTIYPLLKRLKDDGSIVSYIVESQEGPPRKYYSITDKGKDNKDKMQSEWYAFVTNINKILEGKLDTDETVFN